MFRSSLHKLFCNELMINGKHTFFKYNLFSTSYLNSSRMAVDLSYSVFEPDKLQHSTPIVILHGLLGSKQNWRGIGKTIAIRSGRRVYALDARNHGDSPHVDDLSYSLMSADVKHFMNSNAISSTVLIGHSMGGRTAMFLALTEEKKLLEKLIVVDVAPSRMPRSAGAFIPAYMKTMKEAIATVPNLGLAQARKAIDEYLSETIPEVPIRKFLLTNLGEINNSVVWKPNLDILELKFDAEIKQFPPVSRPFLEDTLFISGEISPYIKPKDYENIIKHFPKAKFVVVPGAGHWVHSEKPTEFLQAVCEFL